jgi:formylglycine-generating enzyme required for sulfatase activity
MRNAPDYQPSYFSHEGGGKDKVKEFKDTKQFPRESVGWEDIQEFCCRLSDLPEEKKWGRQYRLPTEEEWEYACRAGTSTPYYLGNIISPDLANVDDKVGRTTPVGHYNNPNKFGLYDMHGDEAQYCDGSLIPCQKDLIVPDRIYSRVVRGGFWGQSGVGARSACRQAAGGNMYYGFRVALSVDPPP